MGNITLHLLISLITLTLACFSVCQDSSRNFVHSHNVARAKVHVGEISWDEKVAAYARDYASQRARDCKLVHSEGPYGVNLAQGSGDLSGTDAVKLCPEKDNYDYNSNTCLKRKFCGHHTQVIWNNSVRLGCAKVRCITNNGTFITCNYDPPGNFINERP